MTDIRKGKIIKGRGQKLWLKAKGLIPGGNMLLSKRPEMFLPYNWPAYFSKANGCFVWDLDGNKYIDMTIMGVGTNILGYCHPEIDQAVKDVVNQGNMSTLNCPEEVWLAEKLTQLHPWSDMVRFARTGGEANAIAIRIARASTGLDSIAICGYHGWHDWYLATNLNNKSGLKEHLLDGLEVNGVPKNLEGSVFPFSFNCIEELEVIFNKEKLAAVKMEVQRSIPPKPGFLEKVRQLCNKNGSILIFDECTSGFRETYGGIHKKYEVSPDMAIFGKALGNGYAISAILGKKAIMNSAQTTFISSTFWTERIGPTAGLKTLEVMEREQSWKKITQTGFQLRYRWQELANKYDLQIEFNGIPSLSSFHIKSSNYIEYKTLITQEMLKDGYLATPTCYTCTCHTEKILDDYFISLEKVFKQIGECESGYLNVYDLLDGPICHTGFKRLN